MSSLMKVDGQNKYLVYRKIESFEITEDPSELVITMISGDKIHTPISSDTDVKRLAEHLSQRVDREYYLGPPEPKFQLHQR